MYFVSKAILFSLFLCVANAAIDQDSSLSNLGIENGFQLGIDIGKGNLNKDNTTTTIKDEKNSTSTTASTSTSVSSTSTAKNTTKTTTASSTTHTTTKTTANTTTHTTHNTTSHTTPTTSTHTTSNHTVNTTTHTTHTTSNHTTPTPGNVTTVTGSTPKPAAGSDLIPIIVGAVLGGLVVIVLLGYFIARCQKSRADAAYTDLSEWDWLFLSTSRKTVIHMHFKIIL